MNSRIKALVLIAFLAFLAVLFVQKPSPVSVGTAFIIGWCAGKILFTR